MRHPLLTLALCLAPLAAGAHTDVADPDVKARMAAMKAMAADMKAVVQMSRGEKPFDAGVARARLDRIVAKAGDIPARFEARADDPVSEARVTIWSNWADFTIRADALVEAASGDAQTPEALVTTLQAVAAGCKACHGTYKD